MTLKLITTALIYFSFSFSLFATDYLMYIGAGGEPKNKDDTIFDSSIKNMASYVKSTKGLKVNVALDGGHKKTEALVEASFSSAVSKTNFQVSDYERLIQTYKTKLEKNEMGPGDQFMIYIETHGSEKTSNTKTHMIATATGNVTDYDTLSGAASVSVDQLEVLKNLAKEKGVKLAIIDTSCHSGNTQALADENTCVISSTGPNHYGYTSFSQNFTKAMTKGKSLEEIFLQTRKVDTTAALPMISTAPGQETTSALYDSITPFLYNFSSGDDKLTQYLSTNPSVELQCNSLINTINMIEELHTSTTKILGWKIKKTKLKLGTLKKLLKTYEENISLVKKEMQALGSARLNTNETFDTPSHKVTYSWKDLLTIDFETQISGLQVRLANETSPGNMTLIKDLIAVYNQANRRKKELLKTSPDLNEISKREEKIRKSVAINYLTSSAIASEERKLYSALYKASEDSQKKSTPNPCKSFKL